MSKNLRVLVVSILIASLGGCIVAAAGVGAAIGIGTYSYIRGDLKRTYGTSMDKTWDATIGALEGLNIKVIEKKKDKLKGEIKARRADDSAVAVTVEWSSENVTEVSIRIGTWGDRDASSNIHDKIAKNLGL